MSENFNLEDKPVIIVGNEKGGCGKTTLCIHIIISLLYEGLKVSSIDLDSRQKSLSTYIENRKNYILKTKSNLPFPKHFIVNKGDIDSKQFNEREEKKRFTECIRKAGLDSDIIVIDTPGSDTYLSRLALSYADTILTPINDSFVDLSVIAKIDPYDFSFKEAGIYSESIWDAKKKKASDHKREINWIIIRNRLSNLNAKNKVNILNSLKSISKNIGCKTTSGFSERVIYREMFLKGLSLPDVFEENIKINTQLSHIAARQELRDLMKIINIENIIKNKTLKNLV